MKRITLKIIVLMMIFLFTSSLPLMGAETAEQVKGEVMARVDSVKGVEFGEMEFGAAILADPITKNIIYEYRADERMFPASVTKLMSFVLIYEGIENGTYSLDDIVTISPGVESIEEGDIKLVAGQQYPLKEMLLAMAIISANDASVAVAEFVAGSEAAYVEKMNQKAAELGMKNTNFMNCTGLHDENHYSTARDLLYLSFYAAEFPDLLSLTSTKSHVFQLSTGQVTFYNTNKLLFWYPGTDGLKTGFTTPAGRCLAATAVQDGMRLSSVVLGGTKKYSHYSESIILQKYGFSKYAMADAVTAGAYLDTMDLPKGKVEEIKVTGKDTITLPTAKEGNPGYKINCSLKEGLEAPVKKGAVIGSITATANGEVLASTDMIAMESIEKQNFFQSFYRFFRDLFSKDK